MMTTSWSLSGLYLILLIWKNGVLQKRRPIWTSVEICAPSLFMLILLGLRQASLISDADHCIRPIPLDYTGNRHTYLNLCDFEGFKIEDLPTDRANYFNNCTTWTAIYTGGGADAAKVMTNAKTLLEASPNDAMTINLQQVDSEVALEEAAAATRQCSFGVVFQAVDLSKALVSYKLRFTAVPGGYSDQFSLLNQRNKETWHTDRSFPALILSVGARTSVISNAGMINSYGAEPDYPGNGFLSAQFYINIAILNQSLTTNADVDTAQRAVDTLLAMSLRRFPFPQWKDNTFAIIIKSLLPLFLTLSMLLTAMFIIKSVVEEKESRLKETFRMLGISSNIQWASWFIQYFLFLFASMSFVTVILSSGEVLGKSDGSLLFAFLMLFAMSTISFMFLISVFFKQSSTAAAAGAVVWFASYIPYRFLTPSWDTLTPGDKTAACLIPTTCMSIGANVIGEQEGYGGGVTWETLYDDVSADDHFNFGIVLQMLMFDTVLYLLLTLYFDAIWPSEYGVPQPWYFCFTPSFWRSCFGGLFTCPNSQSYSVLSDPDVDESDSDPDSLYFETAPIDSEAGLQMSNLRKVFKSWRGPSKEAVVGTSLELLKGEITALLGHNGAGKTTTMSMLSGLIPPTAGTAAINGYDIRKNLRLAQSQLGLCPQKNTLIGSLTVVEHLWLFCKLKGVSDKHVYRYIDQMIEDIQLLPKRHAAAKTLSGGMKRKLSCALALVGQSPVVILDEPTSGCDPSARRAIWDLLLKNRHGRTILLSTHHMDEADILGDRIAIMNDGRVACCGTPLFLKSRYGIGYRLNISINPDTCDISKLSNCIQSHVHGATLVNRLFSDVSFALPRDDSSKFEHLFDMLEKSSDSLGVKSYGMAGASIEDVFLKVGETSINSKDEVDAIVDLEDEIELQSVASAPADNNKVTGTDLLLLQFRAMFIKRFLHLKRNKVAIVSQLLVPSTFTLLAMLIANSYPSAQPMPSRDFSQLGSNYGHVNVIYDSSFNFDNVPASNGVAPSRSVNSSDMMKSLYNLNFACPIDGGCEWGPSKIALFNRKTMMAFDRTSSGGNLTGWFNGQAYHTPAEAFDFATNLILSESLAKTGNSGHISSFNHPLPRNQDEELAASIDNGLGLSVALLLLFGMSFLVAFFSVFPVTERVTKAKHMQLLSGVNVGIFWGSSIVFDSLNLLLPAVLNIILFGIFNNPAFSGDRLGIIFLLFVVYGFASLPMMYLWSFMFEKPASSYSFAVLFNVITGVVAIFTIFALTATNPEVVEDVENIFLVLANFCFGQSFVNIYNNYIVQQYLRDFENAANPSLKTVIEGLGGLNCDTLKQILPLLGMTDEATQQRLRCEDNYLSMNSPGIGTNLVAMVIQGIACTVVLVAIELDFFGKLKRYLIELLELNTITTTTSQVSISADRNESSIEGRENTREDDDVTKERDRVEHASDEDDIIVLKELSKVYKLPWCSGEVEAVNSLSCGVRKGSCFGLLGVNGAGKTTTFKMLTGDESISGGSANLDGFDVAKDLSRARQRVGYAPQYDALIDLMTGRELLTMYARLRGVAAKNIHQEVGRLITSLRLTKHADRLSKNYSGGNKRKLSTALALIGGPPIVLLDEPTSGMDPMARRALWKALTSAMAQGQTIILTSHSMEECDALCTQLAIMVNGDFKCFGSPQHLKGKFSNGCSVTALVSNDGRPVAAFEFICSKFPSAKIEDEHASTIKVRISEDVQLSELFALLESGRNDKVFEDYSVSQTTLEEVFIGFARDQRDVEEREEMYKIRSN